MTEDTRTTAEMRAAHASDPITLSVRLSRTCPHDKPSNECCGYAEWLRVIHTVNGVLSDSEADRQSLGFGTPTAMYDWWAGGWCEEYPQWRVLLRTDGTTNVQAKTDSAAALLRGAVLEVTGREIDDHGMTVRYVKERARSGADA